MLVQIGMIFFVYYAFIRVLCPLMQMEDAQEWLDIFNTEVSSFFLLSARKVSVLILVGNGSGGITEGHVIGVVSSSGSVLFEDELSDIFPCT